jgi:hypothetical protein
MCPGFHFDFWTASRQLSTAVSPFCSRRPGRKIRSFRHRTAHKHVTDEVRGKWSLRMKRAAMR